MAKFAEWQTRTIERLTALGYGFSFGPGTNWRAIDSERNEIAGPFTTQDAFDEWLTEQELNKEADIGNDRAHLASLKRAMTELRGLFAEFGIARDLAWPDWLAAIRERLKRDDEPN